MTLEVKPEGAAHIEGVVMTKKDFDLIARVFADLNSDFNNGGDDSVSLSLVVGELADALATTNGAFDRERFLVACGVSND